MAVLRNYIIDFASSKPGNLLKNLYFMLESQVSFRRIREYLAIRKYFLCKLTSLGRFIWQNPTSYITSQKDKAEDKAIPKDLIDLSKKYESFATTTSPIKFRKH